MKRAFVLFLTLCLAVSCVSDIEYSETPDGLKYRLMIDEAGESLQAGEIMIAKLSQYVNDSLVYQSSEIGEVFNPAQNVPKPLGYILNQTSAGDSVEIRMSAKQYVEMVGAFYPDGMDSLDILTWNFKIDAIGKPETIFQQYEKILEEQAVVQLEYDIDLLKNFAVNNNLEYQQTDEGVLYVVLKEGNGEFPQSGQKVEVNYAVRKMDSTMIDTSNEELARANNVYSPLKPGGYKPYDFRIGSREAILGWDYGVPMFSKGGSGYLLVPSKFAYGPQGRGPLGPNECLLFEIEVVDIKNE